MARIVKVHELKKDDRALVWRSQKRFSVGIIKNVIDLKDGSVPRVEVATSASTQSFVFPKANEEHQVFDVRKMKIDEIEKLLGEKSVNGLFYGIDNVHHIGKLVEYDPETKKAVIRMKSGKKHIYTEIVLDHLKEHEVWE